MGIQALVTESAFACVGGMIRTTLGVFSIYPIKIGEKMDKPANAVDHICKKMTY